MNSPRYQCVVTGCPGEHESKYLSCDAAPAVERYSITLDVGEAYVQRSMHGAWVKFAAYDSREGELLAFEKLMRATNAAMRDELAQLRKELAELHMQAISDVGQTQTALEELARAREALANIEVALQNTNYNDDESEDHFEAIRMLAVRALTPSKAPTDTGGVL